MILKPKFPKNPNFDISFFLMLLHLICETQDLLTKVERMCSQLEWPSVSAYQRRQLAQYSDQTRSHARPFERRTHVPAINGPHEKKSWFLGKIWLYGGKRNLSLLHPLLWTYGGIWVLTWWVFALWVSVSAIDDSKLHELSLLQLILTIRLKVKKHVALWKYLSIFTF